MGGDTSVCRRLPLLSIASPAASPPRRTCGRSAAPGPRLARVCPSGTRISAPLQVRGRRGRLKQVRGGRGVRRPRWTAGRAAAADVHGGATRAAQIGISSARCGSFRHSWASGGVFRPFCTRQATHRAATRDVARPMTGLHGPPASTGRRGMRFACSVYVTHCYIGYVCPFNRVFGKDVRRSGCTPSVCLARRPMPGAPPAARR